MQHQGGDFALMDRLFDARSTDTTGVPHCMRRVVCPVR